MYSDFLYLSRSLSSHDLPSTDDVISVTSEQNLTIGRPSQGDRSGLLTLEVIKDKNLTKSSSTEIVDLNASSGGSGNPVTSGGESQTENLVSVRKSIRERAVLDAPDEDGTLLTTGSTDGSIRGKNGTVDVVLVTNEVSSNLTRDNIPRL